MQQAEASPFLTPSRNSTGLASHADASSKADTGGLSVGDEARRSQASMIGLGSTPAEPPSTWLQNEVKHQKRNRVLVSMRCTWWSSSSMWAIVIRRRSIIPFSVAALAPFGIFVVRVFNSNPDTVPSSSQRVSG